MLIIFFEHEPTDDVKVIARIREEAANPPEAKEAREL